MADTIKYDVSTDTLTGDKVMLYVTEEVKAAGGEVTSTVDHPIAYGTSCSVELSADTIDTTSKMSGNWQDFLTGQLSYTISCDSLTSFTAGQYSFAKLKDLMVARKPIKFKMATWVPPTDSSAPDYAPDKKIVSGEAVITSLSMTAGQGSEICTSSISMTGKGALDSADA